MRSEAAQQALRDIKTNILLASEWSGDLSDAEFEDDRRTFYAVTRCLEIISEASRRLPADFVARHPAYPWRAMRQAGNFYRHVYQGVLERRLLKSVREERPPLLSIVEQELAAETS